MSNPVSRFLPAALTPVITMAVAALFAVGCASTQPEAKPETKAVAETKPAPTAPAPDAQPAPAGMSYNVVRGDHLWGISSKPTIYGNPYSWPLIFKANRDKIKDADLIEPGQVFSIDKNPSSSDTAAAVQHAKTRGEWRLGSAEKSDTDFLARYGVK
jgi:nucleoid-associated protein YgaU